MRDSEFDSQLETTGSGRHATAQHETRQVMSTVLPLPMPARGYRFQSTPTIPLHALIHVMHGGMLTKAPRPECHGLNGQPGRVDQFTCTCVLPSNRIIARLRRSSLTVSLDARLVINTPPPLSTNVRSRIVILMT